jgi:hypothetical protein
MVSITLPNGADHSEHMSTLLCIISPLLVETKCLEEDDEEARVELTALAFFSLGEILLNIL